MTSGAPCRRCAKSTDPLRTEAGALPRQPVTGKQIAQNPKTLEARTLLVQSIVGRGQPSRDESIIMVTPRSAAGEPCCFEGTKEARVNPAPAGTCRWGAECLSEPHSDRKADCHVGSEVASRN